jgi:hypothetical protein
VKQTKVEEEEEEEEEDEEEEGMMLSSVNRISSVIHLEGPKRAMDNLRVITLRAEF